MLPGAAAVAAEVRLSCPPTFRGALIAAVVAGADDVGRSVGGAALGDTRNLWPPYSASNRAENGLASCFRSGSTRMAFLQRQDEERATG